MGRGKAIQNLRDARARIGKGPNQGPAVERGRDAPSSATLGQADPVGPQDGEDRRPQS